MKHKVLVCIGLLALGVMFSCGEKKTATELREKAIALEKAERYDEAFDVYEKLLDEYPNGKYADEAMHKLAFMHYNNQQDFQQAIEFHKRLIEQFPESKFVPQSRFMIGYIYANDLKDYDSARAAYDTFLTHHPKHELVESVNWELEHLGEDVNKQLQTLFSEEETNGGSSSK